MPMVANYAEAEPKRYRRADSWKIDLLGKKSDIIGPEPQAFRLDLNVRQKLGAHFHAVDQFQIFIEGSGTIGRDTVGLVTAHYADHHTAYGPLIAGNEGFSYLTLRSKTDSGLVMTSRPDWKDHLKPSKKRHRNSTPVGLSIPPVLRARTEPSIESVMEHEEGDEGMDALMVRLGPNQTIEAPTTRGTGGQYHIVLNGSVITADGELPPYSLLFIGADEPAPVLVAGSGGLELMIAQFPVQDDWMTSI